MIDYELKCPYCHHEFNMNHDDGFGYDEEIQNEIECPNCQKIFVFNTYISFSYECFKADCLNDNQHKWEIITTYPKEFSKMECSYCGEKREMTDEERKKHNIGTKEDYFKPLFKELKK